MESVFRQQLEKLLFQNTTLCILECLDFKTEMVGKTINSCASVPKEVIKFQGEKV